MTSLKTLILGAAAAAALAWPAAAQEVTLTIQHFLGPKAPAQAKLIEPWAQSVEAASGGRMKFEIFPSMALGGKPPELYRQVRDGVVDIVWTLPGYTPGVFPRVEVFELPGVHRGSAEQTTLAIQSMMDVIGDDFADVRPILVHAHAGNAFHLVDGPITTAAELAGKKIRTPSRTGAWMIESWGAEPVGMPVPDLPQALSKKVVEGALVPFEVVPPLKLQELTAASVEGPGGLRFGTAVFLFAMNKERYASLPEDLRTIIDDHSGLAIAAEIGRVWDEVEAPGKTLQAESPGGSVIQLDQAVYDELIAKAASAVDRWIDEISASGIDGEALVERARAAIAANAN